MKRVLGWCFDAGAAVSAVALISVVTLWAAGYAALGPIPLRCGGRVWFEGHTVNFDQTPPFLRWYSPKQEVWRGVGAICEIDAGRYREVRVSMIHLVALVGALPLFWAVCHAKGEGWGPGHCQRCGYDVRWLHGACPECGAALPS